MNLMMQLVDKGNLDDEQKPSDGDDKGIALTDLQLISFSYIESGINSNTVLILLAINFDFQRAMTG